jgi:hypothetical protein
VYAEDETLSLGNAKTEVDPVHRKVVITDLGDKTSNAYGRLNHNLPTTVPIETALHVKVKAMSVSDDAKSRVVPSHREWTMDTL